jgi:hypothetical protein
MLVNRMTSLCVAAVSSFVGAACQSHAPPAATAVTPIPPAFFDFTFEAPTASIEPGGTSTSPIAVSRSAGFGGSVALHVAGLPAGVTAPDLTLDPATARGLVAFTADGAAVVGDTVVTVIATGGGTSVSHPLPLHVFAPTQAGPRIAQFTPAAAAVFVGESTQLTAVFEGDSASVDGIGPVQSGTAIDTGPLARATTFTLRVRRGPEQVEAQAAVQARYRDRFRALAPSSVARSGHVAAALGDGRAMILGGNTSESINVPDSDTSQVFDPVTETLSPGPQILFTAEAGLFTSLAELSSGDFLLVGGGLNSGPGGGVATQAFSSMGQRFVRVGSAVTPRRVDARATPLADGGALLTGGAGLPPLGPVDRYDAGIGEWRAAGALLFPRFEHTATLLKDGRVLIVGGVVCCEITRTSTRETVTATAEIYDPAQDAYVQTGSLSAARASHAAALLSDGRVLVTGGVGNDPAVPPLGAEIYDPSTGEFTPAGDLPIPRQSHAAVALTDGRVLVVGGADPSSQAGIPATEIFDPATNRWSVGPMMNPAWSGSTVTLLRGGKVLVFGGQTPDGWPVSTVLLFE